MEYINFLKDFRDVNALNQQINREIAKKHDLLLIEVNILAFLHNNPFCDTASEIVQYRGLSKGNVSSAVSSLEKKSLVNIVSDPFDKRMKRIKIMPASDVIVKDIDKGLATLMSVLTEDMSSNDIEALVDNLAKIGRNARTFMEKG